MLLRQIELFFCAVKLLTRAPLPDLTRFEPDWNARAARFYPLVGQGVGAIAGLILVGGAWLWNGWIAVLLASASTMLITGGAHEDGLARTAEGLADRGGSGRRLDIIQGDRLGTYGLAALGLVLGLKIAALVALPTLNAALALLAAHSLSRAAMAVAMALTPYAPEAWTGPYDPAGRGVGAWEAAVALALSLWPLGLLPPMAALAGVGAGVVLATALAVRARRRVGGYTGEILGGVEQVFQVGFLLGVAAVPVL